MRINFRCPVECECNGLDVDCSGNPRCRLAESIPRNSTKRIVVPSTTRRLDVSYNAYTFQNMHLDKQALSWLVRLNLSHCNIERLVDSFFISMTHLKSLDISFNRLRRLSTNLFDSLSNLEELLLIGNIEMITFETGSFSGLLSIKILELSHLKIERINQKAFSGLELTSLSIYHSQIIQFDDNALAGLSVNGIYFNSSKIYSFTESLFDGIHIIEELKTDEFKFCCVRPGELPEEKCLPEKDEFSSCDDLIRNEILRPLIWVIGIFTILTNASSVVYRFLHQKEQLKASFGILVSNLAVSDGIMGAYLVIIAIADVYYRNEYIFHDSSWRNSVFCKLAGVLSTTSIEASVFFICLITFDRFLIIKYPFGQVRLVLKSAWLSSVVVWILALAFAVVPVIVYPEFYSQSGVCLALPISRARSPGWAYAVAMFIGLNSVSYTLVAVGQWSIYRELKAAASSSILALNKSKSRVDTRVAKNLLFVVVTDLLCWIPVGVLGSLSISLRKHAHAIDRFVFIFLFILFFSFFSVKKKIFTGKI